MKQGTDHKGPEPIAKHQTGIEILSVFLQFMAEKFIQFLLSITLNWLMTINA